VPEPRYFGDKPSEPQQPDYLKPLPTTHHSMKHEADVAKRSGGSRVPGSGSIAGIPGDVSHAKDLGENKLTFKTDTRIQLTWLRKIADQALTQGKDPVVHLRYEKLQPPCPTDWVLMPATRYYELLENESE